MNQSKSVSGSSSGCKSITILLLVVLLVSILAACADNQPKDTTKSATASSSMATLGPTSNNASSAAPSTVITTETSSGTAMATSAATTAMSSILSTPATTPVTAATTIATTTVVTPATTTIATGVTEKRLGFMLSASTTGPQTIQIDYIDMFTGAEAIVKAREDGSPVVEIDGSGHYYIPNDYYIRNNNPLIRTFPLATGCVIKMIGPDGGPIANLTVTFAKLRTTLASIHPLMEINVVNGQITTITEFYLP